MAEAVGISRRNYQYIEAGKCKPSAETAISIANFLHCDIHDLFGPQRQLRENNTQPDYINSRKGKKSGIAEARALSEAAKKFDVTDVALDVADNGRIDDPVNRRNAQKYCEAIGAALL